MNYSELISSQVYKLMVSMQRPMDFDAAHYGFRYNAVRISMQRTMVFDAAQYGFRCCALWVSMQRSTDFDAVHCERQTRHQQ